MFPLYLSFRVGGDGDVGGSVVDPAAASDGDGDGDATAVAMAMVVVLVVVALAPMVMMMETLSNMPSVTKECRNNQTYRFCLELN